jgi:hypothetical protein
MAKRKAARRKAVTTRRKAGRSRSASKKVARKKVAKKTVRAVRMGAARKVGAKKRQIKAKAVLKRVKTTRKAAKASRARSTKGLVKRAAPVVRKVAKPAAPVLKKAPSSPKPKAQRAPVRTAPGLNRERRTIGDDDIVQTPPSSLDFDRSASSARSGRREEKKRYDEHTETSPALTGGDVDADWESAYSVGDEAPGGDNPTPDQDLVDDIGRAVGVEYQDNEELKGEAKIAKRDRNRWELDPASSDDWEDR